MKPSESVAAFEDAIESGGSSLLELTPSVGIEHMLSFYETTFAEGCSGSSADMLLFEWGSYDWGEGESFELSITRQFIEVGVEGEPEVSQLRLIFKYEPSSQVAAFGEGSRWCASQSELPDFKDHIRGTAAFRALAEQEAPSVRLSHFYA